MLMTPDLTSPTAPDLSQARAKKQAGPIGFRLDNTARRILAQRADQLGVSPHALARQYVLELLGEAEDREMLREEVTALRSELTVLRTDLALAVEALKIFNERNIDDLIVVNAKNEPVGLVDSQDLPLHFRGIHQRNHIWMSSFYYWNKSSNF